MVKKKISHALGVPELLNEAQRVSSSGHIRYSKMLWDIAEENQQKCNEDLIHGLKLLMTVAEVGICCERELYSPPAYVRAA